MKMKRFVYILVLGTLILGTFSACQRDNSDEPETLVGNVSKPSWAAPDAYDFSSSMTAVVKVDLSAKYPRKAVDWQLKDDDLLAAFSGETCLGVASPQNGLFFLYIASPNDNADAVSLRYYSAHYRNLFEATNAFTFANDKHLGTVAMPIAPTFIVTQRD